MTDLCEYCEQGLLLKSKIDTFIKLRDEYQNLDLVELKNLVNTQLREFERFISGSESGDRRCLLLNEIMTNSYSTISGFASDLKNFEVILFHKNIAKSQRVAYNKYCRNATCLGDSICIELDFKQKINVGYSPRQVNSEYYDPVTLSCLGKIKR